MEGAEINMLYRRMETTVTLCFLDPMYNRNTSLWLLLHNDDEECVAAHIQTVLQASVDIFGFLRNHTNTLTCVASSCMVFDHNKVPVRFPEERQ